MIKLGVNIDHVATLRQARGGIVPSVLEAALLAEKNGAEGITVHLREDRRHIQDEDVRSLRTTIATRLNLEMSVAPEIVDIAVAVNPAQATLVPEKRAELTTEGGLDVIAGTNTIEKVVYKLVKAGIAVSLFIDPEKSQIEAACDVGAPYIEFHTGEYANASTDEEHDEQFYRLLMAAEYAHAKGLIINAGHGLDYENVKRICTIPHLHELNIGHSIVTRAIFVGLGQAVAEMKKILIA
ncbi:MAG: pyridoxine 5'-phosphate synthase [Candidatus Omnitrophica bacterium]|nr:pyridoxine 5'-phosphate synthase [Candidatus Omnitrophota bacterium]